MGKSVNDLLSKYAISGLCALFSIVGYLANDRLSKLDAAVEKIDRKLATHEEKHDDGAHTSNQRLARIETFIEALIRNGCDKRCN